MVQNTLPSNKKKFNWTRGLKDMSQKPHFESGLTLAHKIYFITKSGGKCIL